MEGEEEMWESGRAAGVNEWRWMPAVEEEGEEGLDGEEEEEEGPMPMQAMKASASILRDKVVF